MLLLLSLACFLASALAAGSLARWPRAANLVGAGGAVAGSLIGAVAGAATFASSPSLELNTPWAAPYGSLTLVLDPLSAFFVLTLGLLCAACAVFGYSYMKGHATGRGPASSWFYYNTLVACLVLVVTAANGLLFLVAWEGMALTSFFLVLSDFRKPEVREAAWRYLIASHFGTAFLVAFFALAAARSGTLDFDRMGALGGAADLLFVLAVVGFGTKAGFVPLHVWLPEAHPAAPSHVSALMSGAMIKTGIYGLLRALTLLGAPPMWWGWLLVAIGISSGVLGVLFALAQHDLKRLLAYHSVENIGIIALGIGAGLIGLSAGNPVLAFLGFAGAILHVLNHALFKGLLFLAAGSVVASTGTRDIEKLGGLMKRMPWTGAFFLVGSAAISGLPPFNGFVSEFLIFLGAFGGAAALPAEAAVPLALAVAALALIGGLAVACFAKAFGIVFLGSPRGPQAEGARESPLGMLLPMAALAGLCVAVGALAPLALDLVAPSAFELVGGETSSAAAAREGAQASLGSLIAAAAVVAATFAALWGLRALLLRGRTVTRAPTWDCGYLQPSPRMQYTASSFAQPLTAYFRRYLKTRTAAEAPEGIFPGHAKFDTSTPDVFSESLFGPLFRGVRRGLAPVLRLQNGRVQTYVLYVGLALVIALALEFV